MIVDVEASVGDRIWVPDEKAGDALVERFRNFVVGQGHSVGEGYEGLWRWSVEELDSFWELFASFASVELDEGPVRTEDPMPNTRWFPGRTVNFAEHLLRPMDGDALIAVPEEGEPQTVSREALRRQVAQLADYLRSVGVVKGDRVVAVLPNVPEAVVGLLATASIGAVWSICAPEFGSGAIVSRFAQLEPKVLIATPGYKLSGKDRDRSEELSTIVEALPTVERVVWVQDWTDVATPEVGPDCSNWSEALDREASLQFEPVEFNEPLWVLFSSGTTGTPKGIVHSHGGALLETMKMLMLHSDLRHGDRYLSVASTSWVVWNSLVSSLGVGATPVLLAGSPTYPTLSRVWECAANVKAAVVGLSAGFVHACVKAGLVPNETLDLGKLRCVQVTGSPLSSDGFRWLYRSVGDVWVSSMSGGTDVASIFVGGTPTMPVRVGYIQAPALGVAVESWDTEGQPTKGKGELVVTSAMPSMPLFFWGDADGSRYHDSYFATYPGVWRHGDFIEIGEKGILIHGRSDSTLNRNGLRLGTADIYSVVEPLTEVAEALVVGVELDGDGYYMPLFVQLAPGVELETARSAIDTAIRKHLSARYLPDEVVAVERIPHTRTGKKLEVPVKRLLQGESLDDVADLGAVDEPEVLLSFATFARTRSEGSKG